MYSKLLSDYPQLAFLTARNAVGSRFIDELRNGALVLHRKPKSNHPADNYIEVVLAWFNGKFVVWTCSNLQTGGVDGGNYFTKVEEGGLEWAYLAALVLYDTLGIETNLTPVARARIDDQRVDGDLVEAMYKSQG